MSLRLIQYHCGQLIAAIARNPQVGYHTRRVGEVLRCDINQLAQTGAENAIIWWRKAKNRYNLGD
jgi:hypothetical protein